jgi:IS30 family transposase
MRRQKMVSYQRQQIDDLLVKGASQSEIASLLRISQSTVSRDVEYLESAARDQLKQHIQQRIPHTHLQCMKGINSVIKHAWYIIGSAKNDYLKIHALNVLMTAYAHKLALTTDSTVVNESLNIIEKSRQKLEKLEGDISTEAIQEQEQVF